jgi:hypothetical protein
MTRAGLVVVLALACNSKSSAPPPAPPPAPTPVARDAAIAVSVLAFDPIGSDGDALDRAAYGDLSPRLPAIGSEGSIAYVAFDGTGPEDPDRHVEITDLASGAQIASLPLVAGGSASRARGDAVIARLRGFASLTPVKLDSDGDDASAKLGAVALTAKADAELNLTVALDGVVTARLPAVEQAGYRIRAGLDSVYVDRSHIYLFIVSRGNEEATLPPPSWLVDNLPAMATPEGSAITKAIESDARTPDARVIGTAKPIGAPSIGLSRDGASAWASGNRVSELLVKTPAGWQIAAEFATEPRGDDEAARAAKAGKPAPQLALPPGGGDASLLAAFGKLASDGVDADAAKRADLVAIGSAPGERTVGGAVLARGWNAYWKGRVKIASSVAGIAPSGTTGWVAANVSQAKSGYAIPFTLFCIFDKTAAGDWSLVHVHFGA